MSSTPIKTAEFVKGVTGSDEIFASDLPQIAFVGRSNVGKSSTINILLGRKDIARTSKRPGKTQEFNFYLINDDCYFVDLPGYGYARVSAKEAERWRKRILWYFTEAPHRPDKVVLIIDARRGFTDYDHDMLDILEQENYPVIILINKIDTITQKEEHQLRQSIKKEMAMFPRLSVFLLPFSAKEGTNKDQALNLIFSSIQRGHR